MSTDQIDELLKAQPFIRREENRSFFKYGSIIMFGFSIVFYFLFFHPNKFNPSVRVPSALEAFVTICIIFSIIEIMFLFVVAVNKVKLMRMTDDGRKEYYLNRMKRDKRKVCLKCGDIVETEAAICPKCGSDLEMLYNCMWIDTPDAPKGSDPRQA